AFKRSASLAGQGDAAVGQLTAAEHDVRDLTRAVLQGGDQTFDFFGRLLGALCQTTNFIGDDRKATSGFTGTGGFDGGVEGEQVGLFGDGLDHVHDLTDLVAFLFQYVHGVGGADHFAGKFFDLGNRFAHDLVAITGLGIGGRSC